MRSQIDLPEAQIAALDAIAKRRRVSRTELIRRVVDDFLASRATDPASDAFGAWGSDGDDGVAYQNRLRREW